MDLVTNGSGTGDGGILVGSRSFSHSDQTLSDVDVFVREMLAQVRLDGMRADDFVTASLHAFSLFARLGVDSAEIRLIGRAAEDHFMLELSNGLDLKVALGGLDGGLVSTNFDLPNLIAFVDEVHIGRSDGDGDGPSHSVIRLAAQLPGRAE